MGTIEKFNSKERIGNLCPNCGEILQRDARTRGITGSTGLGTWEDWQTCPACNNDFCNVFNAHRDSDNEFLYSIMNQ